MLRTKMAQQEHMQAVLKDTILMLCQNGLHFQSEFSVEALVAVTVDQSKVLLVSIKETVYGNNTNAQPSAVFTVEDEESSLNAAVKQEFSSSTDTCVDTETDLDICHVHEQGNGSNVLDGLTSRLNDSDTDSHMLTDTTSDIGSKPGTLSTENFASCDFVSPSHGTSCSASPADEALDLTGYVRKWTGAAMKRKCHSSNSVHSDGDYRQTGTTAAVVDIGGCSDSNSVFCIKDEIPVSADTDIEHSLSFSTPVSLGRNCLTKPSCRKVSHRSLANVNCSISATEDATYDTLPLSDQATTDVDVQSVCQAIIAYRGWCVPLRDIQRLRLRGLSSAIIRTAMETLERTGLGRCCEVTGNMCVFYKCPPHLVTVDALARWHLTWNNYSLQFTSLPALNQTNRHNESYWQRVASSSPYSYI